MEPSIIRLVCFRMRSHNTPSAKGAGHGLGLFQLYGNNQKDLAVDFDTEKREINRNSYRIYSGIPYHYLLHPVYNPENAVPITPPVAFTAVPSPRIKSPILYMGWTSCLPIKTYAPGECGGSIEKSYTDTFEKINIMGNKPH